MVEFIIILPALLLVLFATMEVSRLWLTVGVVAEAAREGARAGALTSPFVDDPSGAISTIISVLTAANLSASSPTTVKCVPTGSCTTGSGATVTATVSVPFNTPIPLLVPLFGGSSGLAVSQTAQMRYEP
jgi:Flp pilus assembly protein TadG